HSPPNSPPSRPNNQPEETDHVPAGIHHSGARRQAGCLSRGRRDVLADRARQRRDRTCRGVGSRRQRRQADRLSPRRGAERRREGGVRVGCLARQGHRGGQQRKDDGRPADERVRRRHAVRRQAHGLWRVRADRRRRQARGRLRRWHRSRGPELQARGIPRNGREGCRGVPRTRRSARSRSLGRRHAQGRSDQLPALGGSQGRRKRGVLVPRMARRSRAQRRLGEGHGRRADAGPGHALRRQADVVGGLRAARAEGARSRSGRPIWYELMTPDPGGVGPSYRATLGWEIPAEGHDMPNGAQYREIGRADGGSAGGVLTLTPQMAGGGARLGWMTYFHVGDVDAAVAKASSMGASVHMPPATMDGAGRMAMIADPQGAPFYLMAPTPPPDKPDAQSDVFEPRSPGHAWWNELQTPDEPASTAFYRDLFGWSADNAMPMGDKG